MMEIMDFLNLRIAYVFPDALGDMGYETFRQRHRAINAGKTGVSGELISSGTSTSSAQAPLQTEDGASS